MADENAPNDEGRTSGDSPRWASRAKSKLDSYEKPKKVTREDIADRWYDSYERRAALASKAKKPSTIGKVVTAVALVSAVGLGVSTSMASSNFETKQASQSKEIDSLKSQLKDAQAQNVSVPTKSDAAKLITDANKLGLRFAEAQNQIVTVTDPKSRDMTKLRSLTSDMATSMDDSVKSLAAPWYTITRTKENPWYQMKYSWQAQPPYAFEDDGENIKIIWLCKDDKGTLLSWVIGKYDAETKKITGMVKGMTKAGSDRINTPLDGTIPTNEKGDVEQGDKSLDNNVPTK